MSVAVFITDSHLDEEKLKAIVIELSSQDERQVSQT